jgi:hypothetical protein
MNELFYRLLELPLTQDYQNLDKLEFIFGGFQEHDISSYVLI